MRVILAIIAVLSATQAHAQQYNPYYVPAQPWEPRYQDEQTQRTRGYVGNQFMDVRNDPSGEIRGYIGNSRVQLHNDGCRTTGLIGDQHVDYSSGDCRRY